MNLKEWQLWFHYMLLTIVLFIGHHFSSPLELFVVQGEWYGWPILFVYYFIILTLGDLLIHEVLRLTTGWED